MLRKAFTKKSIDHSDTGNFSFSFFCDKCGKEWTSPSQPFSGEGSPTIENEDALNMLWASEHQAAFNEANLEAHYHFNLCPVCGRWVCDDCFNIAEEKHGGVCKDCCSKEEVMNNKELAMKNEQLEVNNAARIGGKKLSGGRASIKKRNRQREKL